MNKLKAIIVDDEVKSRSVLNSYLKDFCPNVEILGEASNVLDAVSLINKVEVNLVFLDIEMPENDGFDLLNYFDIPTFYIIFVTAYNQYAVKAFKVSAIDYLTKPLKIKDLIQAVHKVSEKLNSNVYQNNILNLKSYLNEQQDLSRKLALPTKNGFGFYLLNKICFIQANGQTSLLKKIDDTKTDQILQKLIDIEKQLLNHTFYRVHRSFIINLIHIKHIDKNENIISMECNTKIPLARAKKQELLKIVDNNSF